MSPRTILHVDMDAFFAAIEQLRRPELKDKPVVVGGRGDPSQRGVVSTASYAARRYGIHSGMPLRVAYRRCPDAVFLAVDFNHYARVSRRIKAILRDYAKRMEDVGLDEAFLDLTGQTEEPEVTAQNIKERVFQETGLTCSIGIGPNKLLAKLASDLEKPAGLTRLEYADVASRIWPLPVRRLWGVGPRTMSRLSQLGVTTIGDLAELPLETLIDRFGEAQGRFLHAAAQGIDDTPVVTHRRRQSITQQVTFQRDTLDRAVLETTLASLAREAVGRLRQYHYLTASVTVKLRLADFETHTKASTLTEPADDYRIINAAAQRCLDQLETPKPVRLVGVRLSRFSGHSATRAEAQ